MLHKYTPKTAAFLLNIVTSLVGVIIEGREVDLYSRAIQVLSILCQFFMVGYLSWLCSIQNEWEPMYILGFLMFTGLCSILFVRWLLHTPAFYDPNAVAGLQGPLELGLGWQVWRRIATISQLNDREICSVTACPNRRFNIYL